MHWVILMFLFVIIDVLYDIKNLLKIIEIALKNLKK